MRCAIYVNVPLSQSAQEAEKQLRQLKQLATSEDWQLTKIYRDQATPASTVRPGYDLMRSDATKGRFDVLLFWALDQLSQAGALASLRILTEFNGWGIHYHSFTEPYLNSRGPHHQAVVSVLATIAKQHSLNLSKRTRRGLERQKVNGSPGPKGRLGPGKPPVEFNHAKARKLREVDGLSYLKIATVCGVSKATIYRLFHPEEKAGTSD